MRFKIVTSPVFLEAGCLLVPAKVLLGVKLTAVVIDSISADGKGGCNDEFVHFLF